jgi:putative ABC transport system substrate-binding protein
MEIGMVKRSVGATDQDLEQLTALFRLLSDKTRLNILLLLAGNALQDGLRQLGYVEGKNVAIDLRYAETGERLRALAGELMQSNVSVIATFGDLAPTMAQQATTTIPIVAMADDFVGAGLAPSLGRPRGNLTGVTILSPELSAKRLAVLKELIPKVSRVAVLWDPASRSQLTATEEAARLLSVKLQVLEVRGRDDLPRANIHPVRRRRIVRGMRHGRGPGGGRT